MGICRYCGQPAGFFRHEHEQCKVKHDKAALLIRSRFLDALNNDINPALLRKNIEKDAHENFITDGERDEIIRLGMNDLIHSATESPISEANDMRISAIRQSFGLSDGDCGNALKKSRILRGLDEGKIDKINTSFAGDLAPRLENDEHGIWGFSGVTYLTVKHRTVRVGGSRGVTVRVMKGVYYHAGGFQSTPIDTQYLSKEDVGGLWLTTQHVYFVGSNIAIKCLYKNIVSVQLHSDGIEILESGTAKKPLIFQMSEPEYAADLLARLQDVDRPVKTVEPWGPTSVS